MMTWNQTGHGVTAHGRYCLIRSADTWNVVFTPALAPDMAVLVGAAPERFDAAELAEGHADRFAAAWERQTV